MPLPNYAEAEEDDNYFVTMTDMMVGLLFIFLIMVAFFAYKLSKQSDTEGMVPQQFLIELKTENNTLRSKLEETEKKLQTALTSLSLVQSKLNTAEAQIALLEKEIQEIKLNSLARFNESSRDSRRRILRSVQNRVQEIDQSIAISADYERGILRLQGVDLFASASTSLLNPSTVRLLADILEKELQCSIFGHTPIHPCTKSIGFVEAVYIEGHTDNLPLRAGYRTDGIQNNLQLSARRASNTYQTMIDSAPGLGQFQNPSSQSIMSVSAYGEQRPLTDNINREARNHNRRIDIRLEMYQPKDEKEVADLESLSAIAAQTASNRNTHNTQRPEPTSTEPSSSVTWEIKKAPSK